jgi:hypothetical protein
MWTARIDYRNEADRQTKPLELSQMHSEDFEEARRLECQYMFRLVAGQHPVRLIVGGFSDARDDAPLKAIGQQVGADGIMYYADGPDGHGWEWV